MTATKTLTCGSSPDAPVPDAQWIDLGERLREEHCVVVVLRLLHGAESVLG